MRVTRDQVHAAGWQACTNSEGQQSNPFEPGTAHHAAWIDGWWESYRSQEAAQSRK